MFQISKNKGFTLVELVLYLAIFGVAAGLMTGIVINVLKVQDREASKIEISSQLNFTVQTIQRLTREASVIDIPTGATTSVLRLRMADPSQEPTYITLENNVIKIKQGTNPAAPLTTDRVIVNLLSFEKFSQPPGLDMLQINVVMSAASDPLISQALRTGTARVGAAVFDADVLPGGPNFGIGQPALPWQDLYLSGVLNLGALAADPFGQDGSIYYNITDNVFRGFKAGAWTDIGGYWAAAIGNDIYYNAGNVGIGTTAPGSRLTIAGAIEHSGNPRYYRNVVSAVVARWQGDPGTVKIRMPKSWSNTMMTMRIQGYDYSGIGAWEVIVAGYNHTGGGGTWLSFSADIRGSAPFNQVRLGHDGTRNVVLLGNTATVWRRGAITVSEFVAAHSNLDGWGTGWEISRITSEAGIGSIRNVPIHKYITPAGNVGIGTTAPGERLEIDGAIKFTPSGTVISRAPRAIRTNDPVTGCPPARAANVDLFTQTFTLARPATVKITGELIRNATGRVDLHLFIDGVRRDKWITFTPTLQWKNAQVVWVGTLAAGTRTISLRSPVANVWGCGPNWGSINMIIFE